MTCIILEVQFIQEVIVSILLKVLCRLVGGGGEI